LATSRLKCAGHVERIEMENLQRQQMLEGNEGEEGRDFNGRTALRETGKESETNGELQQQLEGTGDYSQGTE